MHTSVFYLLHIGAVDHLERRLQLEGVPVQRLDDLIVLLLANLKII